MYNIGINRLIMWPNSSVIFRRVLNPTHVHFLWEEYDFESDTKTIQWLKRQNREWNLLVIKMFPDDSWSSVGNFLSYTADAHMTTCLQSKRHCGVQRWQIKKKVWYLTSKLNVLPVWVCQNSKIYYDDNSGKFLFEKTNNFIFKKGKRKGKKNIHSMNTSDTL